MSDPITIRLLSTRPVADELIRQAPGVVIDAIPFITIRAVADEALGLRIRELATRRQPVVFTSQHAVEAVAGWLKTTEILPWRIYCTGYATRGRIVANFGEKRVAGTAESAGSLAEIIVGQEEPGSGVCFFCGDRRRDELPLVLRDKGFWVNEEVVYQTVATPHRVQTRYDAIAFFSPSAVESFFSINAVEPATPLFAIGPTTAAAIETFCSNPVFTGERPEEAVLMHAMIEHFRKKK
jgi:uroporphyrinogen-III synthase